MPAPAAPPAALAALSVRTAPGVPMSPLLVLGVVAAAFAALALSVLLLPLLQAPTVTAAANAIIPIIALFLIGSLLEGGVESRETRKGRANPGLSA
jgi:hypothetical protein